MASLTSPATAEQFPLMHLLQALHGLLDPLMGFVGSFQRASHSLVGRLDGPFNLSHIHLHKQSFSHLHSSMPIPPSHVHSQNSYRSAPFRLVLTKTLVGNHSQGCK